MAGLNDSGVTGLAYISGLISQAGIGAAGLQNATAVPDKALSDDDTSTFLTDDDAVTYLTDD